jgi:diguanylate cyclase
MSLRHLLYPSARLNLHQRRAWRLLAIGSCFAGVASALWAIGFAWAEAVHPALACAAFSAASFASLQLLSAGRLRLAGRTAMVSALVFLTYNAVWLNGPIPGTPQSAHQYLLALAVLSLLILHQDRPWVHYGMPAASMLVYVLLAGSGFSLAPPSPFGASTLVWGAWSDHVLSAVVVFSVLYVVQTDVVRRDAAEAELRDAILRGQMELHYQPQVDETGRVIGAEALVRWRHPARGMVPPGEFVPLAESSGLIRPLGEWVLRSACRQIAAWQHLPAMRGLVVAVNVSANQFEQDDFVALVVGELTRLRLPAGRLKIELTESALARDIDMVVAKMTALRQHGVKLALDDFGTGFSSLSVLRSLPLDQVKIDQSFVRGLVESRFAEQDAAIVRTIVELCGRLDLDVIAEGVETEAHREVLDRLGCRHYQGYHYGRPMPAAALEAELCVEPAPSPPSTRAVQVPAGARRGLIAA